MLDRALKGWIKSVRALNNGVQKPSEMGPCQIEWLQELWADFCTRNMHMKIDRAVSVLQVE